MSSTGSTHQIQNYTVLQPTSILSAALNSAAAVDPHPLPSPNPVAVPSSGTGDIHICGNCNSQFTDLKVFVDHKQQGCHTQGQGHGGTDTLSSLQPTPSTHLNAPLLSPQSVTQGTIVPVGVPVGMPHVIVQAHSGPPQMYRIVLEQSANTSIASNVSSSTQITQASSNVNDQTNPEQLTLQIQPNNILSDHPRENIDHNLTEGNRVSEINSEDTVSSASNLLQLTSITESWPSSQRDPDPNVELGHGSEAVNTGLSSMPSEEDEVASFLASQLGSQNIIALSQSSNITSGTILNSDSSVYYTSAPSNGKKVGYIKYDPAIDSSQILNLEKSDGSTVTRGKSYASNLMRNNQQGKKIPQDHIQKDRSKLRVCPHPNCNYATSANKDLNRHIRVHTGEKPYLCKECGKRFSRADKLKVHQRIHTNERLYWCKEPGCTYQGIDSGSLKKHIRIHTDERPYKCQMCSYRSRDGSQLTVHLRTHTGDTPFQCMVEGCSSAFKTSSDLKRHKRLHTGAKPYKCDICDYACAIKSNLNMHVKLNHFQGPKFTCGKCSFVGNSRRQLRDHEKTHSALLYKCDLCDHVSTSTPGLRQHMAIHRHEKIYKCHYCLYTSRTARHLNQHLSTKHGCDLTSKKRGGTQVNASSSSSADCSMQSTSRVRVGGRMVSKPVCYRSFKCEECGSGFVRLDSYKSHMRQHEKHRNMMANMQVDKKENSTMYNIVLQGELPDSQGRLKEGCEASNIIEQSVNIPTVDSLSEKDHIHNSNTTSEITSNHGSTSLQVQIPNTGDNSTAQGSIDSYNYVITIGGISTVFPNPGKLNSSVVTEELEEPVEYITSDLEPLTSQIKNNSDDVSTNIEKTEQQKEEFDLSANNKKPTLKFL